MAKMIDVAKLAGVGISTVSRVLNNSANVNIELRKRVLDAIKKLNYSANYMAKSLKGGQTYTIAIVTTSIERVFFTEIVKEITRICKTKGYMVQILETYDDPELEMKIIKTLHSQWIDGIILVSSITEINKTTKAYIQSLSNLKKKNITIPIVMLETPALNKKVSSVIIDHHMAAYKATIHLLEIGRRNIVHIASPKITPVSLDRINGYLEACDQYNISTQQRIVIYGDYSVLCGYKITEELIKSQIYFDGIFTGNDQMAIGALRACKDCEMSVPQQVSVIGYDDVFLASLVEPALSTIRVPQTKIGTLAINKLFNLIEGNDKTLSKEIVVDTELIIRESTMLSAKKTFDLLCK